MRHIGKFMLTRRQTSENQDKIFDLMNQMEVLTGISNFVGDQVTTTAISEKWFDAVADDADIPEYEFTIDEKQAVSCRRLGVVAVEHAPVDAEPVKAPKKKAKKGKA